MIAIPVRNKLIADSQLTALLATFSGYPAVFSRMAPEKAAMPYLTITCDVRENEEHSFHDMPVFIDYYERTTSDLNCMNTVDRITELLDDAILQSERYSDIEFFYFSGSYVPDPNPLIMHYNMQFMAQGIRSKWMNTTK